MSKLSINRILDNVKSSQLAKDSLWAVLGNGLGYAFLLVVGIIIARFLGKDVYGEYGMVKSTMLYIAGFATMGIGVTSTKYISEYLQKNSSELRNIARDAMSITLCFSCMIAIVLTLIAKPLALYLNEPSLINPFKILGCLIICKAISTTQNGILAGFCKFKAIAMNNIACSVSMLLLAIPFTYTWGLYGALSALLFTQAMNCILNYFSIRYIIKAYPINNYVSHKKELFLFSLPIAIQESSYTICSWGGTLLLVKLSSVGELGIFSAVSQWNAVILIVPGLLSNVVLSHLASTKNDRYQHTKTIKVMLIVYFICSFIPFIIVYFLSSWITTFYGPTFANMKYVLQVFIFCTIFHSCSNVFNSEFIVTHHNWLLMSIRTTKDCGILILAYIILKNSDGIDGAMSYATAYLIGTIYYFIALIVFYNYKVKNKTIIR